jgi:hypothetical protein
MTSLYGIYPIANFMQALYRIQKSRNELKIKVLDVADIPY